MSADKERKVAMREHREEQIIRILSHAENRERNGLREPLNSGPQYAIFTCGDVLPQGKSSLNLFAAAPELTLTALVEDDSVLSICQKLNPSVLVARQAFIEKLPRADFARVTDSGQTAVLAILEGDGSEAAKMLRLGCRGVLPSEFSPKLLKRAVQAVLAGEMWAPRRVVATLLSQLLRAAHAREEFGLTPREEHILELMLQGGKDSAIARALCISIETVHWHKRRINRKMGSRLGSHRYPEAKFRFGAA
jgi:DNA-binding NarL/FixJ family response regulator